MKNRQEQAGIGSEACVTTAPWSGDELYYHLPVTFTEKYTNKDLLIEIENLYQFPV